LVAYWDGHRWQQVSTPADAGALWTVATVPGGIASVGSTVSQEDGYAMRLSGNRWESLDLPVDGTVHLFPQGILWSTGRLTMVGASWSDQSPSPQPLILTGRG
jgi:hypothetical protein